MTQGWGIIALAFGYVGALFAIAWVGDRLLRFSRGGIGRPLIYALSIAVYCTSWTFFGSVGLAASKGYDFLPVYLGPILVYVFGRSLLLRVIRLAKSQNITSVADFLAARYGKSSAVAAVVTVIAVIGTLPYIALQLKAVAVSVEVVLGPGPLARYGLPGDTAFSIAVAMAAFAVLFGTRHLDATEHQNGLMLAIAAESVVKLAAFLTVGIFILWSVFGSWSGFAAAIVESPQMRDLFLGSFNGQTWLTVTGLSFVAVLLLPRQFHVTVVENNSEAEFKTAAWVFPLYLVGINLFVVPIAVAGLSTLPATTAPDTFVLALPVRQGASAFTVLAFLGGLSAATAMVIVDAVALAIMVCNGIVVPFMLRRRFGRAMERGPTSETQTGTSVETMGINLLLIRRVAIFVIVLLGYGFYHLLDTRQGLASIGLVSFAAIAQLAPAFFGGLLWRRGTAAGAIAGMLAGFAVWAYTLLLPWFVQSGLLGSDILSSGPFGWGLLAPQALFYLQFDPLTHGVLWSIGSNLLAYIVVSQLKAPEPIERLQANLFVSNEQPRAITTPSFRLWRSSVTVGDLQSTVARYLGAERAERSFLEYAAERKRSLHPSEEADVQLMRFSEHLLASAIGAPSSRLVLSLLLRRNNVGNQSALRLLDDASEAIHYNRDLLQSALDQVRHGLSVFDQNMQLICWNRQFRELLALPPKFGRVGVPLDAILRATADTTDAARDNVDAWVSDRLMKLAISQTTYHERFDGGARILEIRTAPMPQGGIVTTYSDITERFRAAEALEKANESLEARVRARTTELTEVNRALAIAKAKADQANMEKTRFLAAASHDVLQPLNAARLYASSLAERKVGSEDAQIAQNIDLSLEAVEEILGALIEIARLDTGRMEPEITTFPLSDLLDQLEMEFAPLARERSLRLKFIRTRAWVRSDKRLLRRVFQNLISNAIKYTRVGRVTVGVRRQHSDLLLLVCDTGPGIPHSKQALIFKEFQRLEEAAHEVRGLGLGLSIVDRIGQMLGHRIDVTSEPGRGSTFTVRMPRAAGIRGVAGQPATTSPPKTATPLSGLAVMVVDNEPTVLDAMNVLLTGWGCKVLLADGTTAALALLERERVVPAVVLADYHLEYGSGLDTIGAIHRHVGSDIPAVVITADNSPDVQRHVREAGHPLLRKPLRAAALRALVTQLTLKTSVAAE